MLACRNVVERKVPQYDTTGIWSQQPGQDPEHGRLAGTVGTQENQHPAGLHGQVYLERQGPALYGERRGQTHPVRRQIKALVV